MDPKCGAQFICVAELQSLTPTLGADRPEVVYRLTTGASSKRTNLTRIEQGP